MNRSSDPPFKLLALDADKKDTMAFAAPALSPPAGSRLDQLKSQPRKPGEASFFFYDAHFRNDAV